ncbi:SOS response-associated peptidase [Megalodesulfovibrio gigas]|uniref:Abasic site processing protein n=1 Tax=Megalodesulfovibrio gigas (strain ATCC 19364 / DSM 1382 / NCIMB 9332 / VKM B-1759) TaxID=1121448 RepID=T2G872_MEGG1|nr:SOS response-associated peptidase [Megalodesulfovibrio gigas]AGW12384.1 hypothetical protein DGI_0473 [Megalodesulfovibrio gigas DSM 1382 = ATCC 19364]
MCGRFGFVIPKAQAVEYFQLVDADYEPRRNLAPTMDIPGIVQTDAGRVLRRFHWGLVPFWAKDRKMAAKMINARSETVAGKPAFRAAFKKRRCLIPATCFYEWQKLDARRKQPFALMMADGAPFAMAGLWEVWDDPDSGTPLHSATILTTEANALVAPIHDRMPVILPPDSWAQWLDPAADAAALAPLLAPFPAEGMRQEAVGMGVNKAGNEEF